MDIISDDSVVEASVGVVACSIPCLPAFCRRQAPFFSPITDFFRGSRLYYISKLGSSDAKLPSHQPDSGLNERPLYKPQVEAEVLGSIQG